MAMKTFTFGSDEFMQALYAAKNGLPAYPFSLNTTDFTVFVTILQKLALYAKVTHKDIPTIPGYGEDPELNTIEPIEDWAWSWLSGIAETLGVEGI